MWNHRCNWPRGKVVGGSSVLNYMLYVRGNRYDYDSWSKDGNRGWSYNEVLPYFLKSEDNKNPQMYYNKKYHATGGYLSVENAPFQTDLARTFVRAGQELGYLETDINGELQTGFAVAQGTLRNGARCSTSNAFLKPILDRPNLHVSTMSQVTKIHINRNKVAFGVTFVRDGVARFIRAKKEVILSSGSIGSPQLLMLSGIGPRDHLESLGINVIEDLKVGYNLQDHVALGGLTFLINKQTSLMLERITSLSTLMNYVVRGRGLFIIFGVVFANFQYRNKKN